MNKLVVSALITWLFCSLANAQSSPGTPFEFIQRRDVGRELGITERQRDLVNQLQPVCNAQCETRLIEMMGSLDSDLQAIFLALDDELQQQALSELEQPIREEIESDTLTENILNEPQSRRYLQIRTQFRGLESLLDERIGAVVGLGAEQVSQLREIQRFGGELINACQSNGTLSPQQQQSGVTNINNVLIDQSINILNDSQIEIFVNLCGDVCNFDPPEVENGETSEIETPATPTDSASNTSQDSAPGTTQNNPTSERTDRLVPTNQLQPRDVGSLPTGTRTSGSGQPRRANTNSSSNVNRPSSTSGSTTQILQGSRRS